MKPGKGHDKQLKSVDARIGLEVYHNLAVMRGKGVIVEIIPLTVYTKTKRKIRVRWSDGTEELERVNDLRTAPRKGAPDAAR